MTADHLRQGLSLEGDIVDPAEFVNRLLCRSRLERDDDLGRGVFGLRDPSTGQRITVNVQDFTRYTARQLDRLHPRSSSPQPS